MAWSNVDEDAELMRETLVSSDHFDKEDSGIATDESAGISQFIIATADGSRYNVTVQDCGD
jgi:hypothetical protein